MDVMGDYIKYREKDYYGYRTEGTRENCWTDNDVQVEPEIVYVVSIKSNRFI